jgi:dUTP pyrophosphatase
LDILIKRTDDAKDLPLPSYMSEQAAGMDLRANIKDEVIVEPGKIKVVPTGIMIALPRGFEAQVRPRSGLALKHGVTLLNSPGTIDADYRGEIKVLIINFGSKDFVINRGDRIAQIIISKVEQASLIEVDNIPESRRGTNGFGSTGQ